MSRGGGDEHHDKHHIHGHHLEGEQFHGGGIEIGAHGQHCHQEGQDQGHRDQHQQRPAHGEGQDNQVHHNDPARHAEAAQQVAEAGLLAADPPEGVAVIAEGQHHGVELEQDAEEKDGHRHRGGGGVEGVQELLGVGVGEQGGQRVPDAGHRAAHHQVQQEEKSAGEEQIDQRHLPHPGMGGAQVLFSSPLQFFSVDKYGRAKHGSVVHERIPPLSDVCIIPYPAGKCKPQRERNPVAAGRTIWYSGADRAGEGEALPPAGRTQIFPALRRSGHLKNRNKEEQP